MRLSPEQVLFLTDNASGRTAREVAERFNAAFGLNAGTDTIRDAMIQRGIEWKKLPMHRYTDEEVSFLRDHATGLTLRELTGLFNAEFGLSQKPEALKTALKWHGIRCGKRLHRFACAPIGAEMIKSSGYTFVKTAQPDKWRFKHTLLWEAAHGPIPKGHMLIFKDRDRRNITLDNLRLVTIAENAVMNRYGLRSDDPEFLTASVAIADILIKARERK